MKRNFNGFTLAETMIVIVVLGIIATLTIPALVNKNKESVAKTKVRKAMAAYESALNKMIIENDLKSDDTLTAWAGDAENNCANSTNYFKKVQGDGCIFKTSDGIWWNITDIERPVISFKEINAGNEEQITANANNANDKTAFVLVGRFGNDGSLRVDDLGYETGHDYEGSLAQVQKLYNFLSGKKSSGTEVTNCDEYDIICKYKRGDTLPECSNEKKSCVSYEYACIFWCTNTYLVFDSSGNRVGFYRTGVDRNGNEFKNYDRFDNPDGSYTANNWSVDSTNNVYKSFEGVFNADGSSTQVWFTTDSEDNVYKSSEQITNTNGSQLRNYWSVTSEGEVYKSLEVIENGDNSHATTWDIDSNGNIYKQSEEYYYEDGSSCTIVYNPDGTYCRTSYDLETGDEIKEGTDCEE